MKGRDQSELCHSTLDGTFVAQIGAGAETGRRDLSNKLSTVRKVSVFLKGFSGQNSPGCLLLKQQTPLEILIHEGEGGEWESVFLPAGELETCRYKQFGAV